MNLVTIHCQRLCKGSYFQAGQGHEIGSHWNRCRGHAGSGLSGSTEREGVYMRRLYLIQGSPSILNNTTSS